MRFVLALPFILCSRRFWRALWMLCHSEYGMWLEAGIGRENSPAYYQALKQVKKYDDEAAMEQLTSWPYLDTTKPH